ELHGERDERTLGARMGIGEAHVVMRQHEEALAIFEEVYAAFSETLGPEHPRSLLALARVGTAHTDLAHDDPAEEALRRAIAGLERLGEAHEKDLYTARRVLQHLYSNMRRNEEAKRIALEMQGQVGRLFGQRSTEAASMANMLATIAHNEN